VLAESNRRRIQLSPKDGATAIFLKAAHRSPAELLFCCHANPRPGSPCRPSIFISASHPRTIRWKSRDGLDVEGVLLASFLLSARLPRAPTRGTPRRPHRRGPRQLSITSRTYPTQVFLDLGYAVFAPNFSRQRSTMGRPSALPTIESQGFGDFDDVNNRNRQTHRTRHRGPGSPRHLRLEFTAALPLAAWTIVPHQIALQSSFHRRAPPLTGSVTTAVRRPSRPCCGNLLLLFGGTPWAKPESYIRHFAALRPYPHIKTPTLLQVGRTGHQPQ